MADNDDLGVMQAQLGLGARGSMSPLGIPTPMPQIRHPSEAARDAVAMTQSAAIQTMQTGGMVNAAATGGMGFGLGGFSAQYQANMASIRSNQLNPWSAGMASSMMGMGGYAPGMMPSPIQMTPPNMGIYRPMAPPPMMTVPPIPPTPFFPGPFTPNLPPPVFTTAFERNQQLADYRGNQATAMALSAPGAAARVGVDFAGSRVGLGLGALMGARFGGMPGAAIGGAIGAVGGFLGAENFLGAGVQSLVDDMNPIARMSRQGAQVRGLSRDFVVGGTALDVSGSGLNRPASMRLARQLNDLAGQSGFQRETGGMFSSQDLMKITSLSGQQGLLDVAQNPDQITSQVRVISKALKAFMKLANEPDVTEAIKQLGQMRNMGLSLGESMLAVERAKSYGRMAGTSVQGIMQAGGLPGAMVFQQQGLSAGLGLQVGMGALGMARQAVAGGTFNPAQLSMLGGVHGIAQNNMEMAAAMLKQPLMAAAMSNYNPASGGFQLSPNAVGGLARGQYGIPGMANMGVSNMMRAVQQGGIGGLAAFQMDQAEMQDQLGRALGPEGIKMMGMQQILNTRRFLGVGGRGGLFAAAKAMGFTDDQARQSVQEMGSPEFFQGMQRQIAMTRQQGRAEVYERRKEEAPSMMEMISQGHEGVRRMRRTFGAAGTGYDDFVEGTSAYFMQSAQNSAAAKTGQFVRRTPASLLAANQLESRILEDASVSDFGATKLSKGQDTDNVLFYTPGGRAIGESEGLGRARKYLGFRNSADTATYWRARGGLGGRFGEALGIAPANIDLQGALNNIERGAAGTAEGMFASETEQVRASKRLRDTLGDKSFDIQADFERMVADKAKSRSSLGGRNAGFVGSDYDEIRTELSRKYGVSTQQLNMSDLRTVGLQNAAAMSGPKGKQSFEAQAVVNESARLGRTAARLKAQDELGISLFGDKTPTLEKFEAGVLAATATGAAAGTLIPLPGVGTAAGAAGGAVAGVVGGLIGAGLVSYGERSEREKGLATLFGSDSDVRVSTIAALMAAVSNGEAGAQEKLDQYRREIAQSPDRDKLPNLMRRAKEMLERDGGKARDRLSRAGATLAKADSIEAIKKTMEQGKSAYYETKQATLYESGLENLVADKSVISGAYGGEEDIDIRTHLGRVLSRGEGIKEGELKDIADKYNREGVTEEERQALLDKALKVVRHGSGASEAEVTGGFRAETDVAADVQAAGFSAVATDALSQFPSAVSTFVDASQALKKAADQLGNATALGPAINYTPYQ